MGKSSRSNALLAGAIATSVVASALPGSAATFVVNKNFWGNHTTEGTFSWAINQSNITPGLDMIFLETDVSIDDFLPTPESDRARYAADITDTSGLEIYGNGHKLTGEPSFIDTLGVVRTKTNPAPFVSGDVLVNQAYSFARVADNISFLKIDALTVDDLNEFLNIGKGSNVLVRNSMIRNMGAFGNPRPARVYS